MTSFVILLSSKKWKRAKHAKTLQFFDEFLQTKEQNKLQLRIANNSNFRETTKNTKFSKIKKIFLQQIHINFTVMQNIKIIKTCPSLAYMSFSCDKEKKSDIRIDSSN